MRSTTPSPSSSRLEAVARLLDEACADEERHVLVQLGPESHDVELGVRPLEEGVHPFDVLAGFVAPAEWTAIGVRALGTARYLDDPDRPSTRTATTLIVDRDGVEVSLLRTDDEARVLPGPIEGTIPDACRRALGLPTAAPPHSTAILWTLLWLDRLLEAWTSHPSRRRRLTSSWEEIARHHPAVEHLTDGGPASLEDPAALVHLALAHHAAWPWARLREDPGVLGRPGGDLPVATTRWMDDGFFARWAVGAYPSISALATDLPALLGEPCGPLLVRTALELLQPCDPARLRHTRHGP